MVVIKTTLITQNLNKIIYIRSIMHYGLECLKLDEETYDLIRVNEMHIVKKSLKIWVRTRNTLFWKATKIHNTRDRLELTQTKFLIRLMTHEYSAEVINEINNESKQHNDTNSIIEKFEDIQLYLGKLKLKVTLIEQDKKAEQLESDRSIKLKSLLANYESDHDEIYEMLRAF